MSLSRKIGLQIAALLSGLVLLCAAMLWGLFGLGKEVRAARDAFLELRLVQAAVAHAAAAKSKLQSLGADNENVLGELEARDELLDAFETLPDPEDQTASHAVLHNSETAKAIENLRTALIGLHAAPEDSQRTIAGIESVLSGLDHLARQLDLVIADSQQAVNLKLDTVFVVSAALSLVIVSSIAMIQIAMYRSIMKPMRQLRESVSRLSTGEFGANIEVQGAPEFLELASEFDAMARRLAKLYENLDTQVKKQAAELVRSERLASVGFLAAGVAHEINNPLGIISGHAELVLRRFSGTNNSTSIPSSVTQSLEIVRDEAFRCKEIIDKLLSLARSGESSKQIVSVARIAQEVASLVSGLSQFADRNVLLNLEPGETLDVLGNASEIKQVLLNLTVNALEAVEQNTGSVQIAANRKNGCVRLQVSDNGRGMSVDTLDHVFEPFFTQRKGSYPGLGLGLSISHAIVSAHGGHIFAESDGLDRGSRFIVEFPACHETPIGGRQEDAA